MDEVRKYHAMVNVSREHIEIVQEALGPKARIAGYRISVEDIAVWHEKLGTSPDEIVYNYPTITLADVHAALAYYWDHRDEIEQAIAEEKAFVEEFRKDYTSPLERKLGRPPACLRSASSWTSTCPMRSPWPCGSVASMHVRWPKQAG